MTIIGKINQSEVDNLQKAFKRRAALKELLMSLSKEDASFEDLYERIVTDYTDTSVQISDWWKKYSSENNVRFDQEDRWGIDFDTGECYLL